MTTFEPMNVRYTQQSQYDEFRFNRPKRQSSKAHIRNSVSRAMSVLSIASLQSLHSRVTSKRHPSTNNNTPPLFEESTSPPCSSTSSSPRDVFPTSPIEDTVERKRFGRFRSRMYSKVSAATTTQCYQDEIPEELEQPVLTQADIAELLASPILTPSAVTATPPLYPDSNVQQQEEQEIKEEKTLKNMINKKRRNTTNSISKHLFNNTSSYRLRRQQRMSKLNANRIEEEERKINDEVMLENQLLKEKIEMLEMESLQRDSLHSKISYLEYVLDQLREEAEEYNEAALNSLACSAFDNDHSKQQ